MDKTIKIFTSISKILLSLVCISLIGLTAYSFYASSSNKPYKVRVTNVTDSAFTVSWITDKPTTGVVYYGEEDSFLPGLLAQIGKKKAVDDRDFANAQSECIANYNKEVTKTKDTDFAVSIATQNTCGQVEVTKLGKYFVHHVTVQDLDAEKEYFFRVGDGFISHAKGKTEGIEFIDREMPSIEVFAQKTLKVITDIGTPDVAYGTIYTMYYDNEGDLRKEIDHDSLVFLRPQREDVSSSILSAVSNSSGGWTMDLGNIRKEDGTTILDLKGSSLEFIPQSKNFVPAKPTSIVVGDSNFPISLIGNDDKAWGNQDNEPRYENSMINKLKETLLTNVSAQEEDTQPSVKAEKVEPVKCPFAETWLWRSGSSTCEKACSNNGYSSEEKCEEKGDDDDKDEIVVKAGETMECFDEDGCVCLFDKKGNNYMVRIDISIEEKCESDLVCTERSNPPGKEDVQMGDLCIDPGGCECFEGSKYAKEDAVCGQVCGGEVPNEEEEEEEEEEEFPDVIPIGVLCRAEQGCTCVANEGSAIPVGHVDKGVKCKADEKEYASLEEVCGKYSKPATIRYTRHEGTGENILVCLDLDEYKHYEDRCVDGMGALTFASPDFYLIEETGDGKYKLGEKEHFIGRLYCPEVYFSLAIEVDSEEKIKPQVESYTKYKCCVTKGTDGTGTLGYSYSFQKDCVNVANAEKCNISMKSTYCISEKEPNLLFAVLYPRSHDDKFDNDKSICEEENGEGLRGGGGGYSNETTHYGKNCCEENKKEYEVNVCSGSPQVQWDNCINNGQIGKVYDDNPIRFNEFRPGGGNLYQLTDKIVKSLFAQEEPVVLAEDADIETVFYFPESGIYEIATLDGQTINVFGDKNTSYFYFKNRDDVPGYQAPVNPEKPADNEDIIVPRVVAEISVSKSTTAREIQLKEGVNIISFDFLPSEGEDNLEKLSSSDFLALANLSRNNISRISYFSGGQWQGGTTYDFKTGEISGKSFDLVFGKGYVVIAEQDCTISIPGYEIKESIPLAFSSGWNLIGVHGYSTAYTAKTFIESINTIEGLKANNVTWWPTSRGMYQGYQLQNGQEYGQAFPISPLNGYFVRISEFTPEEDTCKSLIWNPGGELNGECGTNN